MKRRVLALSLLGLLALALWSCAPRAEEETGPVVWFAGNTADWRSDTKAVSSLPYEGGELSVEGLMTSLLNGPSGDNSLRSPIPAATRLLGWQLDDGLLRVDLSEDYGSLAGIELTIADYCITLTLSQLPGVERVAVTVSGHQLNQRYRQEFSQGQVILSGAEEIPVEVSADLYFPRTAGRGLGLEKRVFQLTEGEVLAEIVTLALLGGPQSEALSSVIPEGTQLRSVQLEDGVCTVDFSGEFLVGMPADSEGQTLVVYAIVDTLGNLDSVDSVRIRVEGEPLARYGGVELSESLEPDFGLAGSD